LDESKNLRGRIYPFELRVHAILLMYVCLQPTVRGSMIASSSGEENTMPRFLHAALLSAALMAPMAITPTILQADDRVYHDKDHNDDHHWDAHEDKAYRVYVKENHRKYRDFSKLQESDQQAYWGWRHEHSDALLKIDIH
jgi:hypothetical protein